MGPEEPYEDDDQQRAKWLQGLINPIASAGGDPDAPRAGQVRLPNQGQVVTTSGLRPNDPRNAVVSPDPMMATPSATGATVPGATTPSGNPTGPSKTYKQYVEAGLAGQRRNADSAEQADNELANMPDEATTEAPLEAKRAQLAQPIDPSQPQYRPGVGTRIWRGIDAVRRGGVLGALDPADVGAKAYGAPNGRYDSEVALQQQKVAAVDQQLSQAGQAYKAALERVKTLAAERRATAGTWRGLSSGATAEETEENNAARETETERHNQADEELKRTQETNTSTYQTGELQNRQREVNVQAGRLSLEQKKQEFEEAKANSPGGDESIRQPLIDKAQTALQAFKDDVTYQPLFNNYSSAKTGKNMSQEEYIDQLNKFGATLDAQLVQKKQPPLGLRYRGGPNGAEIPIQTPPRQAPQPRKTQATVHSKQQIAVGDTVMYKGKPQVVKGFNAKGQIQFQP
jgi:hypothetical protein